MEKKLPRIKPKKDLPCFAAAVSRAIQANLGTSASLDSRDQGDAQAALASLSRGLQGEANDTTSRDHSTSRDRRRSDTANMPDAVQVGGGQAQRTLTRDRSTSRDRRREHANLPTEVHVGVGQARLRTLSHERRPDDDFLHRGDTTTTSRGMSTNLGKKKADSQYSGVSPEKGDGTRRGAKKPSLGLTSNVTPFTGGGTTGINSIMNPPRPVVVNDKVNLALSTLSEALSEVHSAELLTVTKAHSAELEVKEKKYQRYKKYAYKLEQKIKTKEDENTKLDLTVQARDQTITALQQDIERLRQRVSNLTANQAQANQAQADQAQADQAQEEASVAQWENASDISNISPFE